MLFLVIGEVFRLLDEIENGQVKIDKEAVKRELFSATGNDNMGMPS